MKKKIIITLGLFAIIASSIAIGAYAATDIKLFINGKLINADLQIVDGSSYVPLRVISESLGANVKWDGDKREISIAAKGFDPVTQTIAAPPKSFNVNVNVESGPMKMNVSKVTLDPAYSKDKYTQAIVAVILDVTVENTSTDNVYWNPAQGTFVLNTKEQIDDISALMYSEDVGGRFMGKVVKKGKLTIPLKSSKLEDITSLNMTVSGAINGETYKSVGQDKTTEIILK
jgi:hypothetical protein